MKNKSVRYYVVRKDKARFWVISSGFFFQVTKEYLSCLKAIWTIFKHIRITKSLGGKQCSVLNGKTDTIERLERWPRGEKFWLLFWRTWVWFLGSQLFITPVSRDLSSFLASTGIRHVVGTQTCMQGKYSDTQEIKLPFKKMTW